MINRLVLSLLMAGCLVLGAVVFFELEPAGIDERATVEVASRSDIVPPMRRQQNSRLDELVATTLARPLFSNTRRPPQSAPTGAATDSDLADTRLTGIVTEPGRRIAIFAVNGEKPLKIAEGEAVSGWRIESITPREVSLSGPNGTKVLQPKFDPNLANAAARAPPQPAAVPGRLPGLPAAVGQPNAAVPINPPGMPPRPARLRQQR